jgi:hypothetical protein
MTQRENISNAFLAINYINLSKIYKSDRNNDKINIKKVWDVVLNSNKYENQINDLLKDKIFSKVFFKILNSECFIYQPKLIAASSDKVFKRFSDDLNIEIIKSNKNSNSYYLIITLLKDFKLPLLNLYVICQNNSLCKKISGFNNKKAQMIINKNDEFFDLITNPEAEIFIR